MTPRWFYSVDGQAKYYQDGDYIYSKNGQCEFSVSNGSWYAIKGGAAEYYVSDNWVYAAHYQWGLSRVAIRTDALLAALLIGMLVAIEFFGKNLRKPKK